MRNKGLFLVMEGIDGSGKTEQCKLLVKWLKENNRKVYMLDFPQYGKKSAYHIERYLNGEYKDLGSLDPRLISTFYAIDRFDILDDIKNHIKNGFWIVANRYVTSNMGHQGARIKDMRKRKELIKWIYDFEYNICKLPKPDLNIFLHMPSKIGFKLLGNRGRKMDINENMKHLKLAETSYKDAIKLYPKEFKVIQCAPKGKLLSIEEIHKKVLELIK